MKEPVNSTTDTALRAFKEANLWVVALVLTVVLVPIAVLLAMLFINLLYSLPGTAILITIAVIAFIIYKHKMRMTNQLAQSFVGEGAARTVELLWRPLEIELRQVIESQGAVTDLKSVWMGTESFVKLESGNRFHAGMDEYVNQRQRVTALSSSRTDTDIDQADLEAERQRLVELRQDLLDEARSAIVRYDRRASRPEEPLQSKWSLTSRFINKELDLATRAMPAFTASSVKSPETPVQVETAKPPVEARQVKPVIREMEATSPSVKVEPVPPDLPEPVRPIAEPEPTPTAPPAGLQLDVVSVCEEMFAPKMMSYESNRLFDERYKGQTVRWTGIARHTNTYSYDSTFGENDGTKAEFDVHEIEQGYGKRKVTAFVQLSKEANDGIRSRIGQEIAFEGRLLTCEGSPMRAWWTDGSALTLRQAQGERNVI